MSKKTTAMLKIPKERLVLLSQEIEQEELRKKEAMRIINDDAYFEQYFEQDKISFACNIAPIVRRSVYKDQGILTCQIIPGLWNIINSDRSPVVMRGSKWCMERKYTTKSAISEEITERYFRFIKYSCFNVDKHREKMGKIAARLRKNGWYIHHDYYYSHTPNSNNGIWYLGEWIPAYDERFVSLLEKLDTRHANKIKKEIAFQENKRKWDEMQSSKNMARLRKSQEHLENHKLNLRLKREKKAEQIAAYELIQEMKNANHLA